jgi:hypothetical protein
MTALQRKVLANLHELGSRPLPLAALFAGTGVSSREEVRRVIDVLVKHHYIEQCLRTRALHRSVRLHRPGRSSGS